jgi:hypothetical protein
VKGSPKGRALMMKDGPNPSQGDANGDKFGANTGGSGSVPFRPPVCPRAVRLLMKTDPVREAPKVTTVMKVIRPPVPSPRAVVVLSLR